MLNLLKGCYLLERFWYTPTALLSTYRSLVTSCTRPGLCIFTATALPSERRTPLYTYVEWTVDVDRRAERDRERGEGVAGREGEEEKEREREKRKRARGPGGGEKQSHHILGRGSHRYMSTKKRANRVMSETSHTLPWYRFCSIYNTLASSGSISRVLHHRCRYQDKAFDVT